MAAESDWTMWGQPLGGMVYVGDQQGEGRAQRRVCQAEGIASATVLRPSRHTERQGERRLQGGSVVQASSRGAQPRRLGGGAVSSGNGGLGGLSCH